MGVRALLASFAAGRGTGRGGSTVVEAGMVARPEGGMVVIRPVDSRRGSCEVFVTVPLPQQALFRVSCRSPP